MMHASNNHANVAESDISQKVQMFSDAFNFIRNEELGSPQTSTEHTSYQSNMIDALCEFTDWAVTCSLKNPTTKDLVTKVNKHQHFDRSCRKRSSDCRYGFPRFPTVKTILSVPSRILYRDDDDKRKEEENNAESIKFKVKEVLNNSDLMNVACLYGQEVIDEHLKYLKVQEDIKNILAFQDYRAHKKVVDFNINVSDFTLELTSMSVEDLLNESDSFLNTVLERLERLKLDNERMFQLECDRLDFVLVAAQVPGDNFEERNQTYMKALSLSLRGYSVHIKRDVDEIYINNYNAEWIKCWDGNMDMQVILIFILPVYNSKRICVSDCPCFLSPSRF